MGRPVYQHELSDPDFCWLISNFQENHPDYNFSDCATLPVVFIKSATPSPTVPTGDFSFTPTHSGLGEPMVPKAKS